jgi:hypothetical protein
MTMVEEIIAIIEQQPEIEQRAFREGVKLIADDPSRRRLNGRSRNGRLHKLGQRV